MGLASTLSDQSSPLPKLLVFVPCRAVLFDEAGNVSPISIFTEVHISAHEGIPVDAQAPMQWHVLTLWSNLPEDAARHYEEDVMLLGPDEGLVSHTKIQFSMDKPLQRNVSNMFGFPIGRAGDYRLSLKLKDMANEEIFVQEHVFPMRVVHGTQ